MCEKKWAVAILPLFFLLLSPAMAYPDSITTINERYTISLGNSTCRELECDVSTLWFYIPKDIGNLEARVTVYPICFAHNFTGGDIWNVTVFCQDGSIRYYDMIPDHCGNLDVDNLEFTLQINSTGFRWFGEQEFQAFWCAFKRPEGNNVENIPTEFNVVIQSFGMRSKYIDDITMSDFQSQSNLATTLQSFSALNITIWNIFYNIFVLIAIGLGITFVIGFVPLSIRWVVRKMVED